MALGTKPTLPEICLEIYGYVAYGMSLNQCFLDANPLYFDAAFEGNKDRQTNFGNYGSTRYTSIEAIGYQLTQISKFQAGSGTRGINISTDGTLMNCVSYNDKKFTTSELGAPFDIELPLLNTPVIDTTFNISGYSIVSDPLGGNIYVAPTVTWIYGVANTNPYYPTPNGGLLSRWYNISNNYNMGMYYNGDGTRMFVSRRGSQAEMWGLSNPYVIASGSPWVQSDVDKFLYSRGFCFVENGNSFVSYNFITKSLELWQCPTPYDAFGATRVSIWDVTQLGIAPSNSNICFVNMPHGNEDYLYLHDASLSQLYRFDLKLT